MSDRIFPPVEHADEQGLLALGGELSPEMIIRAYSCGIFPWPLWEEGPIPWFAPPQRAVLELNEFHPGRSLLKDLRRHDWKVTVNTCTDRVIEKCAETSTRKHETETWITPDMITAYQKLAAQGVCHSAECWLDDKLVGGLYGISLGSMFAGESMFYSEPSASKIALFAFIRFLTKRGFSWIDCQVMTPLFLSMGAKEIPREEFMLMLKTSLQTPDLLADLRELSITRCLKTS
jgi:leucyl/phenylalanyl-tRNA--protein transferase